ncbi:MAG: glycosyltransferase [Candidatus Pacebacteria bacterium]|nr:glycosyltransferase [Candidatus Paceibacterota bacterium]
MATSVFTRKKVLFIITKSNWGGAQRYVADMATNLPAHDYEAVVAAGGTGEPGSASGALLTHLEAAHVRTVHLTSLGRDISIWADIQAFYAIAKVIRHEKPDVLHLNSSKVGGLGALLGRILGVPRVIYTAHGWPFWEERNALSKSIIFLASYLTVLLCHRVICISHADAAAFLRLPWAKRNITVIQNGIAPPVFVPMNEARARLFSQTEIDGHQQDAWVVTIAELTKNKNLVRALETIAAYNTTHPRRIYYSIMGTGEQLALLQQHVKKLGIENHVKLHGFVDNASTYLHAFHVFFLPSLKEGVPYVLLEAQASGLPTVATKVGGIPEIRNPQMGRLVKPESVTDMVLGLERANCSLKKTGTPSLRSVRDMVKETLQVY